MLKEGKSHRNIDKKELLLCLISTKNTKDKPNRGNPTIPSTVNTIVLKEQ